MPTKKRPQKLPFGVAKFHKEKSNKKFSRKTHANLADSGAKFNMVKRIKDLFSNTWRMPSAARGNNS